MKSEKRRIIALNNKLISLLDEQIELELFLNPLVNWDTNWLYKEHLDQKYAGREFDISYDWKKKVKEEKYKKENGDNWDENVMIENETKRQIFLDLSKRKDGLTDIILKIINDVLSDGINELTDDQLNFIFT